MAQSQWTLKLDIDFGCSKCDKNFQESSKSWKSSVLNCSKILMSENIKIESEDFKSLSILLKALD